MTGWIREEQGNRYCALEASVQTGRNDPAVIGTQSLRLQTAERANRPASRLETPSCCEATNCYGGEF
jgi:hypothetical protein